MIQVPPPNKLHMAAGRNTKSKGITMPKSDNQKAKLFALYKILYDYTDENNGLSMAEIIAKLESNYGIVAERRSITSDLATLESVFHIEVEARKSDTTRYHLKTRLFSSQDIESLTHSIQTNGLLNKAAARELTNKLKTLCSIHEAKQIQIQEAISDHIRGIDEDILNKINTIEMAIKEDKQIRFSYPRYIISPSACLEYVHVAYSVSPLEIVYTDGEYHLFTYIKKPRYSSDNDIKEGVFYFSLNKIKDVSILSYCKREGIEQFVTNRAAGYSDAAAYSVYGGKTETISMKLSNDLLAAAQDRFCANITTSAIDDKYCRVVAAAEITPEFFGWLFSMGTGARLLTPLNVAQSYKRWLKEVYEMYQVPAKLSKDL
jgi:predicted DNA-binding transcriptional regulator YafY